MGGNEDGIGTAVVDDFLDLLTAKDLASWSNLWAEDAVQEMPFSPQGFPRRVAGKSAILAHYGQLPSSVGRMEFFDRAARTTTTGEIIAEYRGEIEILATGRLYATRYLTILVLNAEGRIALLREYYDPIALTEAWGEALVSGFSLDRPLDNQS